MIGFDEVPLLSPLLTQRRWQLDELLPLAASGAARCDADAIATIVRLVDGRRTKSEILELALRTVGGLQALTALELLESGGYLFTAPSQCSSETLAFWCALGAPLPSAIERLRTAAVHVFVVGDVEAGAGDEAVQALADIGLNARVVAQGERDRQPPSTLDLYVCSDHLAPEFDAINRSQLEAQHSWCLVNPIAGLPLVGPLFEFGRGPCWACLAHWLSNQRRVGAYLAAARLRAEPFAPPSASLSTTRRTVFGLVSVALARALAAPERETPLFGNVLAMNWTTLLLEPCAVRRRPECTACGDPSLMRRRGQAPVRLAAVHKQRPHQGGYRRGAASDTLERYGSLVNARTGAVTFVEPMPARYSPLRPVYISAYPKPASDGSTSLKDCLAFCAGKGRSDAQARASALCEALERASGVYRGDEAKIRGSVRSLAPRALSPALLTGFSAQQYAERATRSAAGRDRAQLIPEPLSDDTEIDWTFAWSLTRAEHRYVPLSYCFSGTPAAAGGAYCAPNGNGVAAGTCLEEAILQGLLELVERDAVAIWWYNRVRRPALALEKSRSDYVRALLADSKEHGREIWVLDLTHDLGIPVCAAIARGRDEQDFSMGFGCHLHGDLAIERALTELNQLGDGRHPETQQPFVDTGSLADTSFLKPLPGAERDPNELLCFDGEHLAADIEECERRLGQQNLELMVVDKTRPDFGLCVAQVIVPGLRHFWPRFAPGRLYEVPVRLGWQAAPTAESALNPLALTL